MRFDRISPEDGLSQSLVSSICQDVTGFMWFGSHDGLNRYDGNSIKIFENDISDPESISNNQIEYLLKDSKNNFWVGCNDEFISLYDRYREKFINIPLNIYKTDSAKANNISGMTEDQFGNIWLSVHGGGLIKFDPEKMNSESFCLEKDMTGNFISNSVMCVFSERSGYITAGTRDKGLILIRQNSPNECCVELPVKINAELINNEIKFFYEDKEENFWVGTRLGLKKMNLKKSIIEDYKFGGIYGEKIKSEHVTCMCEDRNKNIWIGTRNNGLFYFDIGKGVSQNFRLNKSDKHSVSNDTILRLYCDNSNVMWAGTLGGGVCRTDCSAKKFHHIPFVKDSADGHEANLIMCFAEDSRNNLWVGTLLSGVFKINKTTGNTVSFKDNDRSTGFTGKSVFAILPDNEKVWIGANAGGLNMYNNVSENMINFKNPEKNATDVYSLLKGSERNRNFIYCGTSYSGIWKFNKVTEKFELFSNTDSDKFHLSSNQIRTMITDSSGKIWAGTITNGLNEIDEKNQNVQYFTYDSENPVGFPDKHIKVILEEDENTLWLGTQFSGICRFDKSGKNLKTFSVKEGLSNNIVQGMLKDDSGNIWISTNNGLNKFNIAEGSFRKYYREDGLQSNEFNDGAFFRSEDGTFYFGGVNGYNYFKPDEIKDNEYIPEIVITDIKLFNESISINDRNLFLERSAIYTDSLDLTYRESVISFEFAALVFNNPEKNQYAYMMEGFDKDWIYCGKKHEATYTNLDPGRYTFRVKGSNNDGVWNDKGTSLEIFISPPFWKTWWFKSLGAAAGFAVTGLTYRQRLNKIRKEKLYQEEFSRKLIESQENERKKIAGELHHTIAHDVLLTKNKALIALKNPDDIENLAKAMNDISDLASETLKDIREISYNLHPHQLERLGFTKAINSILNDFSKSTDILLESEIHNVDNVLENQNEIIIFRIIQECLNNVMKHSEADKAEVKVLNLEEGILINVIDNGIGFAGKEKHLRKSYGIGLSSISERVKYLNGDLKIVSDPGSGTAVKIFIPTKNNHERKDKINIRR